MGAKTADQVDRFFDWFTDTFGGLTTGVQGLRHHGLLNPMQSLLAESPWYVTAIAHRCALAFVLGGARALVSTAVCLAGIWFFDLWHDAMVTLNMVLVATLLVMVLALSSGSGWPATAGRPRHAGRCWTPARRSRRSST